MFFIKKIKNVDEASLLTVKMLVKLKKHLFGFTYHKMKIYSKLNKNTLLITLIIKKEEISLFFYILYLR